MGVKRMKAVAYDNFGEPIRVIEKSIPSAPEDGVVLQVKATGVCRSDWHGWKGHDSDIADWLKAHEGEGGFTPGHELSGVIHEVGALVTRFKECAY